MIKLANIINFVVSVPKHKQDSAKKALFYLKKLNKKLDYFNDYLDKIYNPFKEYAEVSQESIKEHRGAIHTYSEEIEEIHTELKELSGAIVFALKCFEYDSDFLEMTKVIINEFGDVSNSTDELIIQLKNYDSQDYQNEVISSIDSLKKEIEELKESITERVIEHINKNVLTKNWLDDVNHKDTTDNDPLISKLYKERHQQVKDIIGE